jgi:hypothetical protein
MNTENFFLLYSDYKTVVMDFFKTTDPDYFANDISSVQVRKEDI